MSGVGLQTVLGVVSALSAATAAAVLLPVRAPDRLRRRVSRPRAGVRAPGLWLHGRGSAPPSAGTDPVPVPVVTDLVAAALTTGLPPQVALGAVADALDEIRPAAGDALRGSADPDAAPPVTGFGGSTPDGAAYAGNARGGSASGYSALRESLDLAAATGLGPVPLVLAAAAESRRRRDARRQVATRRLGTLVVLPTGLCLLPAFVLLTVAPLVIDLLTH